MEALGKTQTLSFCYRESYYDANQKDDKTLELNIAKQQQGKRVSLTENITALLGEFMTNKVKDLLLDAALYDNTFQRIAYLLLCKRLSQWTMMNKRFIQAIFL